MKKLILSFLALTIMLFGTTEVSAQLNTPAASPAGKIMQMVGLTEVNIEYSRPGAKDRTVFAADGLVPYGEMWRTGANSATKFSFDKDVNVGGQDLEAGDYAVLTMPMAEEWKIMLYPYESGNWGSYVEKDPAASFTVPVNAWEPMVETMTFSVQNVMDNSADIMFFWENTSVAIPLKVHTEKQVMAQFEKMMSGPSDGEYFAMGSYLHSQGKDLDKALMYVRKVTEKDDARYWQVRREAVILADMGEYGKAVQVAQKSLAGAKEAGNMDYVRMNEASIEEWSKMEGKEMKKAKPGMDEKKSKSQ